MSVAQAELARRLARFEAECDRAGIKLTHQRLEVFREVAGSEEHPDAETVFRSVRERVPTISLDTVYRTLWLLEDLGLVTTLGPKRERTRFDANMESHHHFVCERCGMIRDFESDEFDALEVPEDVAGIGSVDEMHVEVRGLCNECRQRLGRATSERESDDR